jgi:Domain of unknown function (DUF1707)
LTTATRAKDADRQETCTILDNALSDGELSGEEHRERIGKATTAVTLGDLQVLVSDLQSGTAPARLGAKLPLKSRWRAMAAAFIGSVLLGVLIGWGLYGNTGSPPHFAAPAGDPGAKPDGIAPLVLTPPTQLHSLGGLTGLLEQTRKRFGDTMGYRMVIYPTYAVYDRLDPSDDRRKLAYDYRGGWGDPTSSAKTSGEPDVPVDLGKFDVTKTVGIMRGAAQTLHIKPSDVKNMYLIIAPARDPLQPDALTLSVYVSSDYGGGSINFAGDGTITRLNLPS